MTDYAQAADLRRTFLTPETRAITGEELFYEAAPRAAGVHVTHDSALTFTAVFAAINILASNIASLPLQVFERLPEGGKRPAYDYPAYDLIHDSPNRDLTSFKFRQDLMSNTLRWGNGYAEIERAEDGITPIAQHLLPPHLVELRQHNGGEFDGWWYYDVQGYKGILPENMIHIRGLGSDGLIGYSPITMFRNAIGLGIATERLGASLFANGTNFRGILTVRSKPESPEARKEFRRSLEALHGGPENGNRIAVFQDGTTFTPTTMPPDDSQFLQTRTFQIQEVSRIYNVPAHKLGDLSKATFSNIEEQNIDFYTSSLMPWIENIEAEYNKKIIPSWDRKRFFIEHNMNALLRGNSASRSAYYAQMKSIGVFSVNEIRSLENMNPIEGGDQHDHPLNTTTLEAMAAATQAPLPPEPVPAQTPAPAPVVNAVRGVLLDAVGRMVRREVTALRRAAKKPDFATAIEEFYSDHRTILADSIRPGLRALEAATGHEVHEEEIAEQCVIGALAKLLEANGEVQELLNAWERTKADEIVGTIMEVSK